MTAWYEVQANPERVTTVGNAALVMPGVAEVEAGAELALELPGPTLAFFTPLRVKLGVTPQLQVHLASEGFLVRTDLQRPGGVGFGLKVPLFADRDSLLPALAARFDAWSPAPEPVGNVARLQAEAVASRNWGQFGLALSLGGDFASNGASFPMAGLALGWPELGAFSLFAEGRFRAGLGYGGVATGWSIGKEAVIDLGAGYRSDGAIVFRAGFTRSFLFAP
jgi:hypothetical protein